MIFSSSDYFIKFCLNQELVLLNSNDNFNSALNINNVSNIGEIITLPKLSNLGLNIVILSDGSSVYYPFFVSSCSLGDSKLNINDGKCVRFMLSKSDAFSKF